MPLKITLGRGQSIVVNGVVLTNSGGRATLTIENKADIIRSSEIMQEEEINTPAKEVYFLIQSAIIHRNGQKFLDPEIQKRLARLAVSAGGEARGRVFQASSHVSMGDFFKALQEVKAIIASEDTQ